MYMTSVKQNYQVTLACHFQNSNLNSYHDKTLYRKYFVIHLIYSEQDFLPHNIYPFFGLSGFWTEAQNKESQSSQYSVC